METDILLLALIVFSLFVIYRAIHSRCRLCGKFWALHYNPIYFRYAAYREEVRRRCNHCRGVEVRRYKDGHGWEPWRVLTPPRIPRMTREVEQ